MPRLQGNKNKGSGHDITQAVISDVRSVICPLCSNPRPMKGHNFLYRHLEEEHGEGSHDCLHCGASLTGRYKRAQHIDKCPSKNSKSAGTAVIKKRDRKIAVFRSQINSSRFRIINGTRGDLEEIDSNGQPLSGGDIHRFPYTNQPPVGSSSSAPNTIPEHSESHVRQVPFHAYQETLDQSYQIDGGMQFTPPHWRGVDEVYSQHLASTPADPSGTSPDILDSFTYTYYSASAPLTHAGQATTSHIPTSLPDGSFYSYMSLETTPPSQLFQQGHFSASGAGLPFHHSRQPPPTHYPPSHPNAWNYPLMGHSEVSPTEAYTSEREPQAPTGRHPRGTRGCPLPRAQTGFYFYNPHTNTN